MSEARSTRVQYANQGVVDGEMQAGRNAKVSLALAPVRIWQWTSVGTIAITMRQDSRMQVIQ